MRVACFHMDQFGLACERSRLTHLWGEPLALVDSNEILVVSGEARAYGVRVGQTVSAGRTLCAHLTVLPYDRASYEEAAHLIWDVLAIESSVVEPVSPELVYVELRGREADVIQRARWLACAIAERIAIPLQVGLGRTKFLAERAARQSKDASVVDVPFAAEAALLAAIPVELLPKLDIRIKQKLLRLGVRTLGDVLRLPPRELRKQLAKVGHSIERLAIGEDGDRVRPLWPPRSLEEAWRFEDEVSDEQSLHHALRSCAERIAARLAIKREFCRAAALEVRQADKTSFHQGEKLAMPADSSDEIARIALRLVRRMRIEQAVTEVSLKVSELGAGSGVQLSLIDEYGRGLPREREAKLREAIAILRKKFGVGAVITLSMLRQARKIGLWTYPLGKRLRQPCQVAVDQYGQPVRFWRRDRRGRETCSEVVEIQNLWKETEWFWGSPSTRTVYRVETDPAGTCDLERMGVEWQVLMGAD